jgi:predicted MPP superfamily phosphohydrolase
MQELRRGDFLLKAWPVLGIFLVECILFFAHWMIDYTLVVFWGDFGSTGMLLLKSALFLLAFSFIVAALLSYRFSSPPVIALYKFASVWLGFLSFFFLAACLSWMIWFALLFSRMLPAPVQYRPLIVCVLFALALAAGIYGLINAFFVRVRRVPIHLSNLPSSWRGRTALLVSDLHLGHINGIGFSSRIAALVAQLEPDVIFIAGDFFDGVKVDPDRLAAPFKQLSPPLGMYFATGNHDEFGDTGHYIAALTHAGIRVLTNEKVVVEGLQILGVPYHDTTFPIRLRATLQGLRLDRASASILISHVPNRLPIVEQAGVSLQLSGHTHGGQFFPFTWLTRRVFGKFTYGLNSFGALQVYTSYGAGTWGPPMRVQTSPEIVLLQFN